VRDTGVGMTAEARAHLFEKFYRIRNDQTEQITGSGLGLWITRQLIERMKGSITVDSIEGDGSLFTVTFPIYRILEGAMASAVSYTEPTV
jgi:two-component system OmpR family sensor kinase